MYKEASKQKLRVQTVRGPLSIEQLWGLSISELDSLAVSLQTEYKKSGKKSFVVKSTFKDKELKLKFDIVLDVLTTKVDERVDMREASEIKEHNQKILSIIKEKENENLKSLTTSQLKRKLK